MSREDSQRSEFPPIAQAATPAHSEVAGLIRSGGPISFARFMQAALYGQHGYYTTSRDRRADYLTSPQTHPEFGACVARCLERMWTAMGKPRLFAVAEIGAGDGALMRDVLAYARDDDTVADGFAEALDYKAYDLCTAHDGDWGTIETVDALYADAGPFQCVLSNELLDAFPVHRFTIVGGEMLELLVDVDDDGMLREVAGSPMPPVLAERLGHPLTEYPDGYIGEVCVGISDWVADIARIVRRGYALTVDYGHPREALHHPDRVGGTLRCYSAHVPGSDPFRRVGEQDITAHVDFTHLQQCLASHGFVPSAPLMSQADFLELHGYEHALRQARRALLGARDATEVGTMQRELESLRALSDPRSLGAFLVAIHGIGVPELSATSC